MSLKLFYKRRMIQTVAKFGELPFRDCERYSAISVSGNTIQEAGKYVKGKRGWREKEEAFLDRTKYFR